MVTNFEILWIFLSQGHSNKLAMCEWKIFNDKGDSGEGEENNINNNNELSTLGPFE